MTRVCSEYGGLGIRKSDQTCISMSGMKGQGTVHRTKKEWFEGEKGGYLKPGVKIRMGIHTGKNDGR